MPRSIIRQEVAYRTKTKEDDWEAKLAKYIPGEIVAGYLAIDSLMKTANAGDPPPDPLPFSANWFWGVFVILIFVTALYIFAMNLRENEQPDLPQIIIAPIAFFLWGFGLGGPFIYLEWYNQAMGAVILILATILIPIIDTLITKLLKIRARRHRQPVNNSF